MRLGYTFVCALAAIGGCATDSDSDPDSDGGAEIMTTSDGVPEGSCVPGHAVACGCGAEMGSAICAADGSGYGACSCDGGGADDGGSAAGTDGGVDDGGPASMTGATATGGDDDSAGIPLEPSWNEDIIPILTASCGALDGDCHGREAYNAEFDKGCLGWASFENVPLGAVFNAGDNLGQPTDCPDLPLYERIVDRSPWQCGAFFNDPQAMLVIPGDADNSYLMRKIMGESCDDGEPMPPPDAIEFQISDAQIQILRNWIEAGAPFDG